VDCAARDAAEDLRQALEQGAVATRKKVAAIMEDEPLRTHLHGELSRRPRRGRRRELSRIARLAHAIGYAWPAGSRGLRPARLYVSPPKFGPSKRQGIPTSDQGDWHRMLEWAAVVQQLHEQSRLELYEVGRRYFTKAPFNWRVDRDAHGDYCPMASAFYDLAQHLSTGTEWQAEWAQAAAAVPTNIRRLKSPNTNPV
jgi:hypothetical protein